MSRTFILLFFLGISHLLFSQAPSEKALLWEISGNGLKEKSYIYGTFHLLCKEDLALDSVIFKKLNECKELYLELDFDDPKMMTDMQAAMMKSSGESIKQFVTEEEFKKMEESMQKLSGYPLAPFVNMKPILVASFLYPGVLGCAPESPEGVLSAHATSKNIPLSGLETVARQMSVFERIPFQDQALMLKEYLLTPSLFKAQTEQMLDLYRSKDVAAMYAYMEEDEGYAQYLDILLFERNAEWVEKIKILSAKQPVFYGVGAGHLGGDYGVISLLRKEGYIVTPVITK